jgi:chromosomal replication initiation ATPase DnaA
MRSKQQLLKLPIPKEKHYGNWVRHAQVESASSRLALWFVQGGFLWLTSDDVAGKSHLLKALADENKHVALLDGECKASSSVSQLKFWLNQCEYHAYWMLDLPAGALSVPCAYAVFHLIERAKEMNRSLVISWRCDASNMQPVELSSRLMMMEKAVISAPSEDEGLGYVLQSVLHSMQWDMKETVLPTLIQHVPRNLSALLDAIARLDAYSQAHGVPMNGARALRVLANHD